MKKGELFLIPSYLGEQTNNAIFGQQIKTHIERLKYFIVENEKSARRFIKFIYPEVDQSSLHFSILDKRSLDYDLEEMTSPLFDQHDIGVISEAGLPCVADPGNILVAWAHRKNIRVNPLTGPSSIFLALMASGLNGQKFTFHGYLPIDKKEKKSKLKYLEKESSAENIAQIFMETPFRNNALLEDILNTLHPNTMLCIATDITLKSESIYTTNVAKWKKKKPDLHKKPTIFIIQN